MGHVGAVLLASLIVVLSGCLERVAATGQDALWQPVPIEAEGVRWLDDVWGWAYVSGQAADGGPLFAAVDGDEVRRLDVGSTGSVWSRSTGSGVFVVTDDDTNPPRTWWMDHGADSGPPWIGPMRPAFEEVTDPTGRPPDRVWLTQEDEGAAAVGGFLDPSGYLGLRPLDWAGAYFVEGPAGLYLAADASPAELWVGGTEGSYVVAGPVSPEAGATGTGLQVWASPTMGDFAWHRVRHAAFPDMITDMRGWVLDLYVAGPAGERPMVVSVHGGAPLPLPDVRLDPNDPMVLLAEVPVGPDERASVVVQTPSGPVLHRATDTGWHEVTLPPGHVEAAVLTTTAEDDVTAYALVDGTLWWRRLDTAPQTSGSR